MRGRYDVPAENLVALETLVQLHTAGAGARAGARAGTVVPATERVLPAEEAESGAVHKVALCGGQPAVGARRCVARQLLHRMEIRCLAQQKIQNSCDRGRASERAALKMHGVRVLLCGASGTLPAVDHSVPVITAMLSGGVPVPVRAANLPCLEPPLVRSGNGLVIPRHVR